MTSLRSRTRYPSGTWPPIQRPLRLEAARNGPNTRFAETAWWWRQSHANRSPYLFRCGNNRENTGNSVDFRLRWRRIGRKNLYPSMTYAAIPCDPEQGIGGAASGKVFNRSRDIPAQDGNAHRALRDLVRGSDGTAVV